MPAPTRLILASASPRRRELLFGAGLTFSTATPDVDERRKRGEPGDYTLRLALAKARKVAASAPDAAVIGADTTVFSPHDTLLLGKPRDAREGKRMLRALSGRTHEVHTGVAVVHGARVLSRTVRTRVTFRALSPEVIDWYLASSEPYDKAGGYAIQGAAGAFVSRGISGSYSNVVGLPLAETLALLGRIGLVLPWSPR